MTGILEAGLQTARFAIYSLEGPSLRFFAPQTVCVALDLRKIEDIPFIGIYWFFSFLARMMLFGLAAFLSL